LFRRCVLKGIRGIFLENVLVFDDPLDVLLAGLDNGLPVELGAVQFHIAAADSVGSANIISTTHATAAIAKSWPLRHRLISMPVLFLRLEAAFCIFDFCLSLAIPGVTHTA